MKHPLQPLYEDDHRVVRFKENKIVRALIDARILTLNDIAMMGFSQDDQTQFAQLIGYSLAGFHELDYVSDVDAERASKAALAAGLADAGCRSSGCPVHGGVKDECANTA